MLPGRRNSNQESKYLLCVCVVINSQFSCIWLWILTICQRNQVTKKYFFFAKIILKLIALIYWYLSALACIWVEWQIFENGLQSQEFMVYIIWSICRSFNGVWNGRKHFIHNWKNVILKMSTVTLWVKVVTIEDFIKYMMKSSFPIIRHETNFTLVSMQTIFLDVWLNIPKEKMIRIKINYPVHSVHSPNWR